MTTSKSILPALIFAARSSMPISAPAALASSLPWHLGEYGNTLGLRCHWHFTTAPRTTWWISCIDAKLHGYIDRLIELSELFDKSRVRVQCVQLVAGQPVTDLFF
jgi:hypothetical protein